jgi:hypothetical protein
MNKQQWHLVYVAAINFYNWKVSSWNQIAKGKIVLSKKRKGKIGRKNLIYNCRGRDIIVGVERIVFLIISITQVGPYCVQKRKVIQQ